MEQEESNELPHLKSALVIFSLIWIIITSTVVSLLIFRANEQFISEDPLPELMAILPTRAVGADHPAQARIGLYIKDFNQFDIVENKFEFSGIVWFLFDPSIISLDTLSKFSFEKGKLISKSEPTTRIVGGKLFARFDIRVSFVSNLRFVNFPFDSHTIHIILDNNSVTPGEVTFITSYDELTLSPEIQITGWRLKGAQIYTGYSIAHLERQSSEMDVAHPRVIFALDFVHAGVRQAMLIIMPLLLIFCMTMFIFCIEKKYYKSIISLTSGAVTAMLAYRFVIEKLSPQVDYLMTTDYFFFLFLFGVVVIYFINTGFTDLRDKYAKQFITALHLLVILASFLLLRGA